MPSRTPGRVGSTAPRRSRRSYAGRPHVLLWHPTSNCLGGGVLLCCPSAGQSLRRPQDMVAGALCVLFSVGSELPVRVAVRRSLTTKCTSIVRHLPRGRTPDLRHLVVVAFTCGVCSPMFICLFLYFFRPGRLACAPAWACEAETMPWEAGPVCGPATRPACG